MLSNEKLYSMFVDCVLNNSDAIAIIDGENKISYKEAEKVIDRIAHKISSLNVQNTLGIYIESSKDLIYSVWGAIAADISYIPLAVEYPDLRIKYIIENSGLKSIITTNKMKAKIEEIASKEIEILTIEDILDKEDDFKITRKNIFYKNDKTYIIFTSGSTGAPKGVSISPGNIINQLNWLKRKKYLNAETRIIQKTPIGFDAAQWEVLALAAGSCIVVGCVDIYRNVDLLIEYIIKYNVNTIQCVPTLLSNLVLEDKFKSCSSLNKIFSGGEKLTVDLTKKIFKSLPKINLINLYGPTETTINATYFEVNLDSLPEDNNYIIPLGKPVDNVECIILNENLIEVKLGEIGELYIGGSQNSKGYLNRDDLTNERFIKKNSGNSYYKTGDLCLLNDQGDLIFKGRIDNQVKIRGYRVELDEVNASIESHPWVKSSATTVINNNNNDFLISFVELNHREAALMDSSSADDHHRSKKNKTQVKAQLSNNSVRFFNSFDYKVTNTNEILRKKIFSRKNYRYYDGNDISYNDIKELIEDWTEKLYYKQLHENKSKFSISSDFIYKVLEWLSAFNSKERLLYKYAYASPGALYATQIYLEFHNIEGFIDGVYYYNQIDRTLHKVGNLSESNKTDLVFHFVGNEDAIRTVYKNNIKEVLEIETGHILGSLNYLINDYGIGLKPVNKIENFIELIGLNENYYYINSFKLVDSQEKWMPSIELLVQETSQESSLFSNKLLHFKNEKFEELDCNKKIEKKDVIAINQSTYERSKFGISILSREDDKVLSYISLGLALDLLQRNNLNFGFMSSGYSSKSNNNLTSTFKLFEMLDELGIDHAPTYFCLGGKISSSQLSHEGMNEDAVHMEGPAEIIKKEISNFLPKYMIPNQIIVVKKLPTNPSGKVSHKDLYQISEYNEIAFNKPYQEPRTETELWLADLWGKLLNLEKISALDDFFLLGGNSLNVIKMIAMIQRELNVELKAQNVFQYSSLNLLANFIDDIKVNSINEQYSRIINMNSSPKDITETIVCWPGLGGYPLKMKNLASYTDKSFMAIQSYGLNSNEKPYETINEMALADIKELEKLAIDTPLSLWGYSFGAKIAFEVATILEKKNKKINELVLICPGNPLINDLEEESLEFSFKNKRFVAVLLSVFFGKIDIEMTVDCILKVDCVSDFNEYVYNKINGIDLNIIERITYLIFKTYQFDYKFEDISKGDIGFPIKIIKAKGDDYSFVEILNNIYGNNISMVDFECDHYSILNQSNAKKLVSLI
ncbi:amino acid adenylation domain-containing protein [Acinetobacter calcoaceticus]|uniref:amino acid adenylation domain-containing protein n=1 Tax=Acinetobacter calcoaceticus TaxID=471 RepID=UPI0002CEC46D|nr:amino acid adenylation domain-containing protein [Acinetobacter calcoaceticus]ENU08617.1 hypothetical protein F997_02064 [Acinetobacter calcoaceticus NIPH 13]